MPEEQTQAAQPDTSTVVPGDDESVDLQTPETIVEEPGTDAVAESQAVIEAAIRDELGKETPPSEVVSETPAVDVQESPPQPFLEFLRNQGIEKTYESDEDAMKGAAEAMKLVGRRQEGAQWVKELQDRGYSTRQIDELLQIYEEERQRAQEKVQQPQVDWQLPSDPEEAQKYIEAKWDPWMRDPRQFFQDVVLPMLEPKLRELGTQIQEQAEWQAQLKADKSILDQYGKEIADVMDNGAAYQVAKELVLLRHKAQGDTVPGQTKTGSAAKEADLARAERHPKSVAGAGMTADDLGLFKTSEDVIRAEARRQGIPD